VPGGQADGWIGLLVGRLLVAQCSVGQAKAGAVLGLGDGVNLELIAACPAPKEGSQPPPWLARSVVLARQILADPGRRTSSWQGLYPAESDGTFILLLSLNLPQIGQFIQAFALEAASQSEAQVLQQRMTQTARMVEAYDQQVSSHGPAQRLQMLKAAVEVLSAVHRHQRFLGAAMACCNQMASQWSCERVSLGVLRGRMIHLKATNHAEHFSRKSKVIQDIESAMEECLDQDVEISFPVAPEAAWVYRAAAELSSKHGSKAILSLPLRIDGTSKAVVLLERPMPFDDQALGSARLTCDLCGPALLNLLEQDRWFGAKLASRLRRILAVLVGSRYTWTKLVVVGVMGLILFTVFGKGQYRVEAPFVLEATVQQSICAPFDGYIKDVNVDVGNEVLAGQSVLAVLDTADMRLQLASAKAEHAGYLKQVDAFMRDGDIAKAQIAQADADKVQAQMDLIEYTLGRARLISPIGGTVVKGELKRQIGAPVKTGEVLFEVTPLESLRAEVLVPEDQILDLALGQEGTLATASYPGQKIRCVVERINPMAEVVNGKNVFKVRTRLEEGRPWMRPGMEGVAKVKVDRRPYLWIWTRKLINWIRMTLWW
jgi:biotin carboxyl carrier protein